MSYATQVVRRFIRENEAATMPEYALMVAFVALVCFIAVLGLGVRASLRFARIAAAIGA